MKNYFVISMFVWSLLVSCNESKQDVVRVSNQPYTVVSDSIYTRMPGKLLYQNGTAYWQDPTSSENFVHAIDVQSGNEIACFANIGQGPTDFSVVNLSLFPEGGILLNDMEKPLEIRYQMSSDKDSVISSVRKYSNAKDATRLLYLTADRLLYLSPDKKELFHVVGGDGLIDFGKRPIQEAIDNSFSVFQGHVAYNSQKNLLVYSALEMPYVAVYKGEKGKNWNLQNEIKEHWDYTIQEGVLKFSSEVKRGAWEIALTKDCIVLLQRDSQVEGAVDREKEGRDMETIPHSLFVYDYDLKLKKIIHMPFPMLRLCGDTESNTIYAMSINPEFELIKIDL